MSAIRSKNTKPELTVRRWLWAHGYRYRLNDARLPGKPDIVLRKYRTCIFVNGCFWHGHESCRQYSIPKTNTEFWVSKVRRNRERDAEVRTKLTSMSWHCITIWECTLKPSKREETLLSLLYTLDRLYLRDHQTSHYEIQEGSSTGLAAEDATDEYGK